MCGIVGILGKEPVALHIVEALKRLEYRGYDSAGVATLESGEIGRRRAPGKLRNLEARLTAEPLLGTEGIGHTRWATHGPATETNAHPHMAGDVVIVHNGIIENFRPLKDELIADGHVFATQTDTEVVAHLIARERQRGKTPREAVKAVLSRLEGAFALAILFKGESNLLIGARKGSPLAIGHGNGEMFLGSDAIALAPFTNKVTYLEDGDWAVLTRTSVEIFDSQNRPVKRAMSFSQASAMLVDKGNHRHYMAKEIAEQPEVIGHTLAEYVDFAERAIRLPESLPFDFATLDRITITACGTASYAGLAAKYWFEKIARLPTEVDIASEFRYRDPIIEPDTVVLAISQSGETADTLAALEEARKKGAVLWTIVNAIGSQAMRIADGYISMQSGPEIGVASTKAYTAPLVDLYMLAVLLADLRGLLDKPARRKLIADLRRIPDLVGRCLDREAEAEKVARNTACGGEFFLVIHRKGEERLAFFGFWCADDGTEQHRIAHADEHRAVGLCGKFACFKHNFTSIRKVERSAQGNLFSHDKK